MSEALAFEEGQTSRNDFTDQLEVLAVLSVVPDLEEFCHDEQDQSHSHVVDAASDAKTGAVIRPSIDVSTKKLANGQPLESFFDRGPGSGDVRLKAARALAEATKLYQLNR